MIEVECNESKPSPSSHRSKGQILFNVVSLISILVLTALVIYCLLVIGQLNNRIGSSPESAHLQVRHNTVTLLLSYFEYQQYNNCKPLLFIYIA